MLDDRTASGHTEHTIPPWITVAGMIDPVDTAVARHEIVRLAGIADAGT